MQYSEGAVGRIFAIRLEHGDPMPASLEQLAAAKGVRAGLAIMVGGADDGSRFVVGPEDGETLPPVPMVSALRGVHEAAAVGTLFPDETGEPVLHMHSTFGREDAAVSGCIREGIVTWHILEVILLEITDLDAVRMPDETTGFKLLQCKDNMETSEGD